MSVTRSANVKKAACAAAAVATCWAVGQEAHALDTPISLTSPATVSITPTDPLSNLYLVYGIGLSGTSTYSLKLADTVAGGTTTTYNVTLDIPAFDRDSSEFVYTLLGVTNASTTPGVSILLTNDNANSAITDGSEYTDLFFEPKADLITALQTDDTPALEQFLEFELFSIGFLQSGDSGTLVNFSTATNGGSASLVPEPGSLALLGLGGLLIARRRRG